MVCVFLFCSRKKSSNINKSCDSTHLSLSKQQSCENLMYGQLEELYTKYFFNENIDIDSNCDEQILNFDNIRTNMLKKITEDKNIESLFKSLLSKTHKQDSNESQYFDKDSDKLNSKMSKYKDDFETLCILFFFLNTWGEDFEYDQNNGSKNSSYYIEEFNQRQGPLFFINQIRSNLCLDGNHNEKKIQKNLNFNDPNCLILQIILIFIDFNDKQSIEKILKNFRQSEDMQSSVYSALVDFLNKSDIEFTLEELQFFNNYFNQNNPSLSIRNIPLIANLLIHGDNYWFDIFIKNYSLSKDENLFLSNFISSIKNSSKHENLLEKYFDLNIILENFSKKNNQWIKSIIIGLIKNIDELNSKNIIGNLNLNNILKSNSCLFIRTILNTKDIILINIFKNHDLDTLFIFHDQTDQNTKINFDFKNIFQSVNKISEQSSQNSVFLFLVSFYIKHKICCEQNNDNNTFLLFIQFLLEKQKNTNNLLLNEIFSISLDCSFNLKKILEYKKEESILDKIGKYKQKEKKPIFDDNSETINLNNQILNFLIQQFLSISSIQKEKQKNFPSIFQLLFPQPSIEIKTWLISTLMQDTNSFETLCVKLIHRFCQCFTREQLNSSINHRKQQNNQSLMNVQLIEDLLNNINGSFSSYNNNTETKNVDFNLGEEDFFNELIEQELRIEALLIIMINYLHMHFNENVLETVIAFVIKDNNQKGKSNFLKKILNIIKNGTIIVESDSTQILNKTDENKNKILNFIYFFLVKYLNKQQQNKYLNQKRVNLMNEYIYTIINFLTFNSYDLEFLESILTKKDFNIHNTSDNNIAQGLLDSSFSLKMNCIKVFYNVIQVYDQKIFKELMETLLKYFIFLDNPQYIKKRKEKIGRIKEIFQILDNSQYIKKRKEKIGRIKEIFQILDNPQYMKKQQIEDILQILDNKQCVKTKKKETKQIEDIFNILDNPQKEERQQIEDIFNILDNKQCVKTKKEETGQIEEIFQILDDLQYIKIKKEKIEKIEEIFQILGNSQCIKQGQKKIKEIEDIFDKKLNCFKTIFLSFLYMHSEDHEVSKKYQDIKKFFDIEKCSEKNIQKIFEIIFEDNGTQEDKTIKHINLISYKIAGIVANSEEDRDIFINNYISYYFHELQDKNIIINFLKDCIKIFLNKNLEFFKAFDFKDKQTDYILSVFFEKVIHHGSKEELNHIFGRNNLPIFNEFINEKIENYSTNQNKIFIDQLLNKSNLEKDYIDSINKFIKLKCDVYSNLMRKNYDKDNSSYKHNDNFSTISKQQWIQNNINTNNIIQIIFNNNLLKSNDLLTNNQSKDLLKNNQSNDSSISDQYKEFLINNQSKDLLKNDQSNDSLISDQCSELLINNQDSLNNLTAETIYYLLNSEKIKSNELDVLFKYHIKNFNGFKKNIFYVYLDLLKKENQEKKYETFIDIFNANDFSLNDALDKICEFLPKELSYNELHIILKSIFNVDDGDQMFCLGILSILKQNYSVCIEKYLKNFTQDKLDSTLLSIILENKEYLLKDENCFSFLIQLNILKKYEDDLRYLSKLFIFYDKNNQSKNKESQSRDLNIKFSVENTISTIFNLIIQDNISQNTQNDIDVFEELKNIFFNIVNDNNLTLEQRINLGKYLIEKMDYFEIRLILLKCINKNTELLRIVFDQNIHEQIIDILLQSMDSIDEFSLIKEALNFLITNSNKKYKIEIKEKILILFREIFIKYGNNKEDAVAILLEIYPVQEEFQKRVIELFANNPDETDINILIKFLNNEIFNKQEDQKTLDFTKKLLFEKRFNLSINLFNDMVKYNLIKIIIKDIMFKINTSWPNYSNLKDFLLELSENSNTDIINNVYNIFIKLINNKKPFLEKYFNFFSQNNISVKIEILTILLDEIYLQNNESGIKYSEEFFILLLKNFDDNLSQDAKIVIINLIKEEIESIIEEIKNVDMIKSQKNTNFFEEIKNNIIAILNYITNLSLQSKDIIEILSDLLVINNGKQRDYDNNINYAYQQEEYLASLNKILVKYKLHKNFYLQVYEKNNNKILELIITKLNNDILQKIEFMNFFVNYNNETTLWKNLFIFFNKENEIHDKIIIEILRKSCKIKKNKQYDLEIEAIKKILNIYKNDNDKNIIEIFKKNDKIEDINLKINEYNKKNKNKYCYCYKRKKDKTIKEEQKKLSYLSKKIIQEEEGSDNEIGSNIFVRIETNENPSAYNKKSIKKYNNSDDYDSSKNSIQTSKRDSLKQENKTEKKISFFIHQSESQQIIPKNKIQEEIKPDNIKKKGFFQSFFTKKSQIKEKNTQKNSILNLSNQQKNSILNLSNQQKKSIFSNKSRVSNRKISQSGFIQKSMNESSYYEDL